MLAMEVSWTSISGFDALTRIFPVERHLSVRSELSEPAVNSLRSSSFGTLYGLVWKLSGSRMTSDMREMVG
jgi:hypothetical protein